MKKKLLFLMLALLAAALTFTSCSKDDEPQNVANVSVSNTVWKSSNGLTMKFYSNGTFEFTWKCANKGEYVQVGNEINMVGQTVWYNDCLYNLRYAHIKGNEMDVEMFRALIEDSMIHVKFHKAN